MNSIPPNTMPMLPPEVILLIAEALPRRELSVLSRTCQAYHRLLSPLLAACFNKEAADIRQYAIRANNGPLLSRTFTAAPYVPQDWAAFQSGFVRAKCDLYVAVRCGSDAALDVLLDNGAPLPETSVAVELALSGGDKVIVEMLLEAGAPGGRWLVEPEMSEWKREMLRRFGGDMDASGKLMTVGDPEK